MLYYNENVRVPALKEKSNVVQHALSFLASLVIHAFLLYFLAAHFVSVKILDFKERVTDIIIAPRPKLEAPRIEGPLPELPSSDADLLFGIPSRRRPLQPLVLGEASGEAPTGSPGEGAAMAGVEPKFTEGFRLDSQAGAQALASPNRLRLTIPERQPPPSSTQPAFSPRPKAADLRQYVYPGLSGVSGVGGPGKAARRTPSQVRLVSPSLLTIDLSPWARRAVETIHKNWHTPVSLASGQEVAMEVAIVVLKTGEITSIEIITASQDNEFNQAAREAIEISSPLPALPADFPAASLEVTLIFARQ